MVDYRQLSHYWLLYKAKRGKHHDFLYEVKDHEVINAKCGVKKIWYNIKIDGNEKFYQSFVDESDLWTYEIITDPNDLFLELL